MHKNYNMFGKVKKWLGIEGVKLELILPEVVSKDTESVKGRIRFTSMNQQTVTYINIVMLEKFSRGRGDEKLSDEYEMGNLSIDEIVEIPSDEVVEIAFELPIEFLKSEMDELEDRNFILGGLVKAAKWARGVESEFYIIAEARVKGVALNPFDKKVVIVD